MMAAAIQRKSAARVAPAPVVATPRPVATGSRVVQLQTAMRVSQPSDPAEREAESTAKAIVGMPAPVSPVSGSQPSPAAASRGGLTISRKAEGQPNVAGNVAAELGASVASGSPLPLSVRRFMEPRFRADFSQVRVHTGERSAQLNRQFSARAFALGNQIFFGRDQFKPDSDSGRELIAHELTHTIQQGAAIQRSPDTTVVSRTTPHVQRLGLGDALDYFADKAHLVPGFRMLTILLGVNPINMSRVERSAANIMRAIVEFMPGGVLITEALDKYGIFDRVGNWVSQQLDTVGVTVGAIKNAISEFLDSLSWTDIFDLGGVWSRAKRIVGEPIDRIISFGKGLIVGVLKFVREAVLRPIAALAEGTRGYDLIKAVLGQDPVTGDPVPRNADTLIGGFMKLIGQEEIWENIKKGNAVARTWAWFQTALNGLLGFVRSIPTQLLNTITSLELADLIVIPRAFGKLASVIVNAATTFFTWAGQTIWNLLEIVFDVVSPGALGYIKKTGAALKAILRNPIPFVGNLVKAAMLGFNNFTGNILTHLKTGLIDWLTGSLSGVYIPTAFSLVEIVKFTLSVLGITWQNIRRKLVTAIGETAVKALETGFDLVVTLVTKGPAAAWEQIKEHLATLKDTVISGITDFVIDTIVKKAVPKIVSMFIPGAGFISAILSIYDTVMVFVNKISKIIQVVKSFVDSIVAIAGGAITAAASRVESTLAGLLALAINFLAGFIGLGKVADKIKAVLERVRAPIDKALDALVKGIVATAKRLGKLLMAKGKQAVNAVRRVLGFKKALKPKKGEAHTLHVGQKNGRAVVMISSVTQEYRTWINSLTRRAELANDQQFALMLIGKIDALEQDTRTTNKDNDDAIIGLLEDLGRITLDIMGEMVVNYVKTTPPVFSGTIYGFARGMRVVLSTDQLATGTPPSPPSLAAWATLNRRRVSGGDAYYVLGHLLNQRLGGTGRVWENLTPLSRSGNAQHDQQIERFMKPPSGGGEQARAFNYIVTPAYGRSVNTGLIAAINAASNADPAAVKALKEDIVRAEQYVPTALVCSYQEVDEAGQRMRKEGTHTIPNAVEQRSPADYHVT